ncbi:MAG: YezD family protein [Candidatus Spyradosoma sp.]
MDKPPQEIIDQIVKQLSELRFGELTVVVHDGKVMQIEVKQKIRLPR